MTSRAQAEMARLAQGLGPRAHQALDMALDKLSFEEQVALAVDWRHFWARPPQLPPDTAWLSWGTLGGRGLGKTISVSKYVNVEARSGRATLIGLAAQDEANCVAIQVLGPSGVIATAPPDFKPVFEASKLEVRWPNGARAYVRTPEVPGKIRGLEYHLFWCTEIQSWPTKTLEEAYRMVLLSTRLGYARLVWDATPKRGHLIIKRLLLNGEQDPARHVVVRGSTHENAANLGDGYIEKLEAAIGGTRQGREELGGEQLDDAESAIARQIWIDRTRVARPSSFARRGLGVDPAVTSHSGSDETGIIEAGLGHDDRGYVLGDYGGKYEAHEWAKVVLDTYVANRCDVVVVETNKGGNLLTSTLRSAAATRDLRVIVIGRTEWRSFHPKHVYVIEVYSKGEKADRAKPLATAYEAGRISHVKDADLVTLEETLTTWEPTPGARSPDDLDALTHIMGKLLGLTDDVVNPRAGFKGIEQMSRAIQAPPAVNLAALIRGGGGRI